VTIGDRLREERERLSLSQPKLAEAAHTTKQTVFSWESGKTAPDAVQLAAMAGHGADVLYIVTGARDYEPPPALTAEERVMLDYFRQASPAVRRAALGALLGPGGPGAGGISQNISAPVSGSVAGGNIQIGGRRK
jgi:transcriptional regulator with XRE-family HTH domain